MRSSHETHEACNCWLLSLACRACCCGLRRRQSDPKAGAPPPLKVERVEDPNVFQVDHPEQFPLTPPRSHMSPLRNLKVTGTVNPDISRNVPVDFAGHRPRRRDRRAPGRHGQEGPGAAARAKRGYLRRIFRLPESRRRRTTRPHAAASASKLLYDKGAISLNDLQVAQDTEAKAKVDVKTTAEKLRVLGNTNLDHPSGIVDIRAPISGVITDQQVTNAAGVRAWARPIRSPSPI